MCVAAIWRRNPRGVMKTMLLALATVVTMTACGAEIEDDNDDFVDATATSTDEDALGLCRFGDVRTSPADGAGPLYRMKPITVRYVGNARPAFSVRAYAE